MKIFNDRFIRRFQPVDATQAEDKHLIHAESRYSREILYLATQLKNGLSVSTSSLRG